MSCEIEKQLADAIDSSWHYSWHWDRNEYGSLTDKGWQQVLADAESRLVDTGRAYHQILRLLPSIRGEVRRNTQYEREQEELDKELNDEG